MTSIMNLDARFALLRLKHVNCYSFYFEGKACSVHGSKEQAVKAAFKYNLEQAK